NVLTSRALDFRHLSAALAKSAPAHRSIFALPQSRYALGDGALDNSGIPGNGTGWNQADGSMETVVVLFLDNPAFLELHLVPGDGPFPFDHTALRAKIGLEELQLASARPSGEQWIITFDGPKIPVYRSGVQLAFIACMN